MLAGAPCVHLPRSRLSAAAGAALLASTGGAGGPVGVAEAAAGCGVVASRSEARAAVKAGGLYVNGSRCDEGGNGGVRDRDIWSSGRVRFSRYSHFYFYFLGVQGHGRSARADRG